MTEFVKAVQEVAFHRNGISGNGFYIVRFTSGIDAFADNEMVNTPAPQGKENNWLAILFDEPGSCAVICLDLIPTRGVAFAQNSWRGDQFEPHLRRAIDSNATSGGVRVGPFCIPTE